MKHNLLALVFALPLSAQVVIDGQTIMIEGAVFQGEPPMPAQVAQVAAANAASANSNQKDPEALRKELLSKLKFDRTPSGILQEQSLQRNPEAKKPQPDPLPAEPKDEKAAAQAKLRKQYQEETESFRRNVVLGNWKEVGTFLANLPEDLGKTTYSRLLTELGKPVQVQPRPEVMIMGAKPHPQPNYLSTDDVIALSDAAPAALTDEALESLAKLLPSEAPQSFLQKLASGTRHFGKKDQNERYRTSRLLLDAELVKDATAFLPDLKTARETEQIKALNTLSRYHAKAHLQNLGAKHLPLAWELCLEVMSQESAAMDQRGEALYRALSLVPELEEGAGEVWLKETFSNPAGEGFEILAAVGTLASQAQKIRQAPFRLQQSKLQHGAAEALLATEGIALEDWQDIFTIYALNWLTEAELSNRYDQSSNMRPEAQWDNYGNMFYAPRQYTQNRDRNEPNPIPTGELIELAPSQEWIAIVDEAIQLQLLEIIPRLLLKVKEHQKAFPYIKDLSRSKPETAKSLVRNLINVWAENHNPNQQNRYRNSYYYFYGYNNRAETIPLTRSKQERNLEELAALVQSIRELELGESFNEEFASAFITVHSQAEVWRVEALQKVFGSLDALEGETVASLIEKMRINLAALWPDPRLQEANQTKRTDKERHQQVIDGYNMARQVTAKAWGNEPESWRLLTQLAALTYEESNYLSALKPQATHSSTKRTALDDFAEAAKIYADSLPLEKQSEESTTAYETWFFGALGSPLLEALKNHHMPVQSEFAKIKAALDSLPDKIRERHYKQFASTLNTRLANVSPDLKYRYLEAAISIVGDHEEIESASEVFAYYQDLITEIELVTTLDGEAEVGTNPFGLFVNIHHTREIERESGGFQRYLQNQNNVSYSYNFGRPTEDYRDKFEKAARAALAENFEVLSVTFHTDKIDSRTSSRLGWRVTPYAYFLLKAKGPQTDTVPPLKIDLDFLDTSGHVVLPVSSANIPVVASTGKPRPVRDLKLTMTLDERNAAEKEEWYLEVKTSAKGLIPPLDELVSLPPKDFEIKSIEDRELQVEELTTETQDGAPLASHEYRLTLQPTRSGISEFTFPVVSDFARASLAESDSILRQRYRDVDLVPVGETVMLTENGGFWLWLRVLLPVLLLALVGLFFWRKKGATTEAVVTESGPEPPQTLTPVSLLQWLRNLQENSADENQAAALRNEISTLERQAFSAGGCLPELEEIVQRWGSRSA